MVKNTGTDSEDDFELRIKRAYGKRAFIYRVTDSKEVRGRSGKAAFTKAQPSDYIVTIEGKMFYAEVKSSNNKTWVLREDNKWQGVSTTSSCIM